MSDIIINLTIPDGGPTGRSAQDLVIPMLLRQCPRSKIAEQIGLNWDTYFDFNRPIRIAHLLAELSFWRVPSVDLLKRIWIKGTKSEGISILRWVTMKHDPHWGGDLTTLANNRTFVDDLNENVTESLMNCNHPIVWKKYPDYQGCFAEIMPVNQLPLLMTMIAHNWNTAAVTAKIERRLKEGV